MKFKNGVSISLKSRNLWLGKDIRRDLVQENEALIELATHNLELKLKEELDLIVRKRLGNEKVLRQLQRPLQICLLSLKARITNLRGSTLPVFPNRKCSRNLPTILPLTAIMWTN